MDKKNIFIIVAIVLGIGLLLIIFLSLQVVKDTKSIANIASNTSLQEQAPEKPSIYDLDIATTQKREVRVLPKVDEKNKIVTIVPKQNIKTFEQEQAELSAGIQQDYNSSEHTITAGTSNAGADLSQSQEGTSAPESENSEKLNPTDKDVQDLHRRGIVIF
jgi:uncharacterized lipoprotein YajG